MTTAVDEVGNHDGTYVNSPTLEVTGQVGSAVEFNGTDQRVDVGTLGSFGSGLGSGFTIEFWAKWTATGAMSACGVLNDGSNTFVECRLNSNQSESTINGQLAFFLRGDDGNVRQRASSRSNLNDGEWHHVVLVWDGSDQAIFIDGVDDSGSTNNSGTPSSFSNFEYPMLLGARNVRGSIDQHFDGALDEFALYDSVLSPTRIAAHYNAA